MISDFIIFIYTIKIIKSTMENKLECKICGKVVTKNNSYIGSHVKRKHGMLLEEYVNTHYTNLTPEFKKEKCGFCDNDAKHKIDINHDDFTFKLYYEGYSCDEQCCKDAISKDILGCEYNKKKFEHIGSNSLYLSKKYKISIEEAKSMKHLEGYVPTDSSKTDLNGYKLRYGDEIGEIKYNDRCEKIGKSGKLEWYVEKYGLGIGTEKWNSYLYKIKCTLDAYIDRYGLEIGTTKYNERCEKISKSNKLEWYIEKFGDIEGNTRWETYITKLQNIRQNNISKTSLRIKDLLDQYSILYEMEFKITSIGKICDYYLKDYNTIIEFYGDYWHCNPLKFDKTFYHTYIKKTAEEVWYSDDKRINEIYNSFNGNVNIITIWEETSKTLTKEYLLKTILDNLNKNVIIKL